MKNYRSYVLTARINGEIIEIDWTKIKEYSALKKQKYKLEKIDFFTQHYLNPNELLNFLINTNLLPRSQISKAQLWIYPAKQIKLEKIIDGKTKKIVVPEYASAHLKYGLAYKDSEKLFNDDQYTIYFLQSKLNDEAFITKLYNKYAQYGAYSEKNMEILKLKIENTKRTLVNVFGQEHERYERILKSYYKQYFNIREMYGLLVSIQAYAQNVNRGNYLDNEAIESARNNIREFYLREKYKVISCTDGLNDNRYLKFEKDKDGNLKVNYLALHELLMFIVSSLPQEFNHQNIKVKKKNDDIEGQLSFFDKL